MASYANHPATALLSLLVVVLLLASCTASAQQLPLAGNCNVQTTRLADGSWLGMYCNNLDTAAFGYNWTWIDLDGCVANNGGTLIGKADGRFINSCSQCGTAVGPSRRHDGSHRHAYTADLTLGLRCICKDGHGRTRISVLDLNTVLVDVDGALGCYGRLGNKTLKGPQSKH